MSERRQSVNDDADDGEAVNDLREFLEDMAAATRELAVFVTPSELNYYVLTSSTHSQTLKLFNPYSYPVKYKVFSNARERYSVLNPEGTLPPKTTIDLIVRHTCPHNINTHSRDLLKIVLHDITNNQLLGKKIVPTNLLPGERDEAQPEGSVASSTTEFESSPPSTSGREASQQSQPIYRYNTLIIAAVLFAVIMLPTCPQQQEPSNIPEYLHVCASYKIVAAFFLGFLMCVIIRPTGL